MGAYLKASIACLWKESWLCFRLESHVCTTVFFNQVHFHKLMVVSKLPLEIFLKARKHHLKSSKCGKFWMFICETFECLNEAYKYWNFGTIDSFKHLFSASEVRWIKIIYSFLFLVNVIWWIVKGCDECERCRLS